MSAAGRLRAILSFTRTRTSREEKGHRKAHLRVRAPTLRQTIIRVVGVFVGGFILTDQQDRQCSDKPT